MTNTTAERFGSNMSGVQTILDKLAKEVDKKSFAKDFENNLDLSSGVEDNIFYYTTYKAEDFEDGEFPIEGEEWDEALAEYIDSAWNEFTSRFRKATEEDAEGIYITRCIGVDDAEEFVEALKEGRTIQDYKGLGIYWSWDKSKADCHWGQGSDHITVHGFVDVGDINYWHTAVMNLHPSMGEDEAEIRIVEGADLMVLSVEDSKGNEIWDGEKIVKAHLDQLPGGLADEKSPEDLIREHPMKKVVIQALKTVIKQTVIAFQDDRLPGGLGDDVPYSEIDPEELKLGVEVELEHTNDPDLAAEIAKDHLCCEDPNYYTKLIEFEKEL